MKDNYNGVISEEEVELLNNSIKDFISYVSENQDRPLKDVLVEKMMMELPDRTEEEIRGMVDEISETLELEEENLKSLREETKKGKSRESWFFSKFKKAFDNLLNPKVANDFKELDSIVENANNEFAKSMLNKDGTVNQNPNFDGFIAEKYHEITFNMNAKIKGSEFTAKALDPSPKGYTKNSVDNVIRDKNGKIVRKYQAKFYKDPKSTRGAYKKGQYQGQRKLVSSDQVDSIEGATSYMEAPDGTRSTPFSKSEAKKIQKDVQEGGDVNLNYNDFEKKSLFKKIFKGIGTATIFGAMLGAGAKFYEKKKKDEYIEGSELVEEGIKNGADAGIKHTITCALKTVSEKGAIKQLPQKTPIAIFAGIAFTAVENAKIAYKIATKKCTLLKGLDEMGEVTTSTAASFAGGAGGVKAGAIIGSILGPVGTTIGSVLGGIIGGMAGSEVGKKIYEGNKKIVKKSVSVVESIKDKASDVVSTVKSKAKSAISGFCSFFGF